MRILETLLSRRWILKSQDRELYYQVKDEIGSVKKFLTEKLGYQVIVNPYLVKVEKLPAKPENWMGITEFTEKIEYVFFCLLLMFLEDKDTEYQFTISMLADYISANMQSRNLGCFLKIRVSLARVARRFFARKISAFIAVLLAQKFAFYT